MNKMTKDDKMNQLLKAMYFCFMIDRLKTSKVYLLIARSLVRRVFLGGTFSRSRNGQQRS